MAFQKTGAREWVTCMLVFYVRDGFVKLLRDCMENTISVQEGNYGSSCLLFSFDIFGIELYGDSWT